MVEHVLMEQVGFIEKEDGVDPVSSKLFDMRAHGVEDSGRGRGRRESEREAELSVKVAPTKRPPGVSTRPTSPIAAAGSSKQCRPQKDRNRSADSSASGMLVALDRTNSTRMALRSARRWARTNIEGDKSTAT